MGECRASNQKNKIHLCCSLPDSPASAAIINKDMEEILLGPEEKEISDGKEKFLEESKKLWRIAFPAMLARVTQFGMYVVTQAFIGHIGKLELAAYALIQIINVRFAHGILLGMSSATDTLCGQAFGAKQYHMMDIYLQRSLIINLGASTIMLPFFIFSATIFKVLGEEDDMASVAGYISLWFIPVMYFLAIHITVQQYLQAQFKNTIVGWLSAVSFLLHVFLSWILVSILKLGIPGAMSAMILSNSIIVIGEFVYVLGGWCPSTWKGFSSAAFSDLFPVLKLSVSSGIKLCLEVWYNAVLVLLAGYMKNATTQISAFSICLNITAWELMLFVGLLAAISVRVANELGRGSTTAAKFSVKVTLITSTSTGLFFFTMCLIFRRKTAYLFTKEEEVADIVSSLTILLAFSLLLNSFQTIFTGVAVGAGWQGIVAHINIGCYYVVGVPLGVLLAYVAHLQVKGIWAGMIIGVLIQSLILGYIILRTDWDEQVRKATERLNLWLLRPSEISNEGFIQETVT